MIDHLARYAVRVAEKYARADTPPHTVLNINAPLLAPEKLLPPVYAPLDAGNFIDGYERRQSPRAWARISGCWRVPKPRPPPRGTDLYYLGQGHITLTLMGNPVSLDRRVWDGLDIG